MILDGLSLQRLGSGLGFPARDWAGLHGESTRSYPLDRALLTFQKRIPTKTESNETSIEFIKTLKAGTLNGVLPVCAPVSRVLERNPKYTFPAGKGNETWPSEIFICCLIRELLSNCFYPVHRCFPQKMLDCRIKIWTSENIL